MTTMEKHLGYDSTDSGDTETGCLLYAIAAAEKVDVLLRASESGNVYHVRAIAQRERAQAEYTAALVDPA